MADLTSHHLFKDFVYAKLTADLNTTDTTVVVDDVSLFPSNSELAFADLWMTIESALTYPNTFEIVKITNVDVATNTLTLVRGLRGGVSTHTSGTYIKATITADTLRQLAFGYTASALPTGSDTNGYESGAQFFNQDDQTWYYFKPGLEDTWVPLGGGGAATAPNSTAYWQWPTREDIVVTQDGEDSLVTGDMGAGYYTMHGKRKAWALRLNNDFTYWYDNSATEDIAIARMKSNMVIAQNFGATFTGLAEGDRVDITWFDGGPSDVKFADGTGTVVFNTAGLIEYDAEGTGLRSHTHFHLVTSSTTVSVHSLSNTFVMVSGSPSTVAPTFLNPDEYYASGTEITVSDVFTQTPDDYSSIGSLAGQDFGQGTAYNTRWFTYLPESDTTASFWAENDGNEPLIINIFNESNLGFPDAAANSSTPNPSATYDGSAFIESFTMLAGRQYYIGVGTMNLNPVLETYTNFYVTLP